MVGWAENMEENIKFVLQYFRLEGNEFSNSGK